MHKGIIKLNTIATKGTADYPWQNTYLIMELWNELKDLQAKVEALENREASLVKRIELLEKYSDRPIVSLPPRERFGDCQLLQFKMPNE